jgi:hypothetical protein
MRLTSSQLVVTHQKESALTVLVTLATLLPLSLHQLSGYLAEIAFKLGHFTIAKQAAEAVCTAFVVRNEHYYANLDARVNPALALRLNVSYINLVSPIEAK